METYKDKKEYIDRRPYGEGGGGGGCTDVEGETVGVVS